MSTLWWMLVIETDQPSIRESIQHGTDGLRMSGGHVFHVLTKMEDTVGQPFGDGGEYPDGADSAQACIVLFAVQLFPRLSAD